MSVFKKKKRLPKTEDAKVTILPVVNSLNPKTNKLEYAVVVESNMVDLINNKVNEIELTAEADEQKPQLLNKPLKNISKIIEENMKSSFTPKSRKIKSLDPKMSISHGDLAKSNYRSIKEEIEQESIVFQERKMLNLPLINLTIDNILSKQIQWQGVNTTVATTENVTRGKTSPKKRTGSFEFIKPEIVKKETKTIPKKTKITSIIRLGKDEKIKVSLKNSRGEKVAQVGSSASKVIPSKLRSNKPKYLRYFKLFSNEEEPFNISISENKGEAVLHITSRFRSIRNFQVLIREISNAPEKDRYITLGTFNNASAKKINTNYLIEKNILVHVVPIVSNEKICWSQTFVHRGIDTPTTAKICAYQITEDSINSEILKFKIYDYPRSSKKVYAVRENILSGDTKTLHTINLSDNSNSSAVSLKSFSYYDTTISLVNSMYRYDFFSIDIRGMESHIGSITCRTFERDISGIRFRNSNNTTLSGGNSHEIDFSVIIPDIWFPKQGDDLNNPGDSIFEACRERKKIGVLQLVRHSSVETSKIIGNFIISADKNISDIPITVTDEKALTGKFIINPEFSKKYGLLKIDKTAEYIYEIRIGYYFLSNELSFLKNPIKLTVPNQFTNGKVGYEYHPYLHDSPLSKDFGIIPKLGESKHRLIVESLTNISKIFTFNENFLQGETSPVTLDCKIGAQQKSKNDIDKYVIIEADIPSRILNLIDHVEIMFNNSTTGKWTSIGRHRITESGFYYIDTVGPKIACNKLKYALIARNYSMETIFSTISSEISLKNHNYIERPKNNLNRISFDKNVNNKLR